MNKNPMSKKFRSRMVRSGVLASAGYGLLFGACAEFVAALTCWLLDVRAVWLRTGGRHCYLFCQVSPE